MPRSLDDARDAAATGRGREQLSGNVAQLPLVDASSEADALTAVIRRLSTARTLAEVMAVTTHAARALLNADGVTFVLREGDLCHYADQDAIGPLWKGRKFPMSSCISGWVMEHGKAAVIADITQDERIPQEAYRPTFVKSLAMVPIGQEEPIGAMGAYWADLHAASSDEVERLQTVANAASLAVAFVQRCEAENALRDRASMLDALLKYAPEGITIARAPDVTIERVSAEGLKRVRKSELEVTGIDADLHPAAWQVFDEAGTRLLRAEELPLTRAVKRGETIENARLNLGLPDGELLPILCNAGPIRDETGEVTGGIATWHDISDLLKLEEERHLLTRELNHRLKNLFSVLSGMVVLTARSSSDVDEMAQALIGRLGALAEAHDLIRPAFDSASERSSATLEDLVERLLAAHCRPGDRRCRLSGPAIPIGPEGATKLALVVHELATNAAKYGALSTAEGRLDVIWQAEEGLLCLEWREEGGPPVDGVPDHQGFGGKLIQLTVERQLGGTIRYRWSGGGLNVTLSVPLTSLER